MIIEALLEQSVYCVWCWLVFAPSIYANFETQAYILGNKSEKGSEHVNYHH